MTMTIGVVAFAAAAFALSYALTGLLRRYALRRGILDVPNARSSHSVPTPRGGGLAFATVFLGAVAALAALAPDGRELWLALLGGVAVAFVGWLDDRRGLGSGTRFSVHGLAAAWALYWLGGFPSVTLGTLDLHLGAFGTALAWLLIVWLLNLYNFMDGIDGLAAGQAVLAASVAGCLLLAFGHPLLAVGCLVLAGSVGGFLVWNWPPARIFMGDVGSGLLGFSFAVIALGTEAAGVLPLAAWLVLLAVFVVDATATLLRRMLQGEAWYEPHASHAYQCAARRTRSHAKVTIVILCVAALLGVNGVLIATTPNLMLPVTLVSFGGLLAAWLRFSRTPTGTA